MLSDCLLKERSRYPIPQVDEEYGHEDHYETTRQPAEVRYF